MDSLEKWAILDVSHRTKTNKT